MNLKALAILTLNLLPVAGLAAEGRGNVNIADVPVLDQEGRPLRFVRDLVRGRVVAINFLFTSCTTICPPLAATFARVQELAREAGVEEWQLISISVDPEVDRPARLKSFMTKFGAQPGWTFVTGSRRDIDQLTGSLGVPPGPKAAHSPLVILGNEPAGVWSRAYGLSPAPKIVRMLQHLAAGRQPGTETAGSTEPQEAR